MACTHYHVDQYKLHCFDMLKCIPHIQILYMPRFVESKFSTEVDHFLKVLLTQSSD